MPRVAVVFLILTLLASGALAAQTFGVFYERICEDIATQLRVTVWNQDLDNPNLPEEFTVIRRTTAPGLAEPLLLTETPIPLPGYMEEVTVVVPDPGLSAGAIGYYEAWAHYADGDEVLMSEGGLSCVANPYLMRARLVTDDLADPCENIGLLECTSVLLADLDLLQYVGTGELLDIYGWPVWLDGPSACGISVTVIEPLGEGATCTDVVAVEPRSWSAVKSLYR